MALADGRAVGLHFGGRFGVANFAVPAAAIRQLAEESGLSLGYSTVSQ
jgi:hypothetical protein